MIDSLAPVLGTAPCHPMVRPVVMVQPRQDRPQIRRELRIQMRLLQAAGSDRGI